MGVLLDFWQMSVLGSMNFPDHVTAMGHTKQEFWYQYHEDMKINFIYLRRGIS